MSHSWITPQRRASSVTHTRQKLTFRLFSDWVISIFNCSRCWVRYWRCIVIFTLRPKVNKNETPKTNNLIQFFYWYYILKNESRVPIQFICAVVFKCLIWIIFNLSTYLGVVPDPLLSFYVTWQRQQKRRPPFCKVLSSMGYSGPGVAQAGKFVQECHMCYVSSYPNHMLYKQAFILS